MLDSSQACCIALGSALNAAQVRYEMLQYIGTRFASTFNNDSGLAASRVHLLLLSSKKKPDAEQHIEEEHLLIARYSMLAIALLDMVLR